MSVKKERDCDEIKEKLLELIKEDKNKSKINPQIYIQLRFLLDFEPERWIQTLIGKFDFEKYFEKMYKIEDFDVQKKVKKTLLKIISILEYFGDSNTIKSLIQFLKIPNLEIKRQVIRSLGNLGYKAVNCLIETLKYESTNNKIIIAETLADLGGSLAIHPLTQILKDENTKVRKIAVEGLGNTQDTWAIEPLIESLKDKDILVRRLAADSLSKIGGKKVFNYFIQVLKDEDANLREIAVIGLLNINDIKAMEPLLEALREETNEEVIRYIKLALGKMGSKKVFNYLIQALNEKDADMREIAAIGLANLNDNKAMEPLLEALRKETNEKVKRYIEFAIDKLK